MSKYFCNEPKCSGRHTFDGEREDFDLMRRCRVGGERDEQVGAGVGEPEQVEAQLAGARRHVQLVLAAVELRRRRRRRAVALTEQHQLRASLRERHLEPVDLCARVTLACQFELYEYTLIWNLAYTVR